MLSLDAPAELAALGVRYVSLDRTQLPRVDQERIAAWLEAPGVALLRRDEERVVYAVNPAAARPTALLGAGWYELEQEGERRWRWMGERAELVLLARKPSAVTLSLRATAFGDVRSLALRQGETPLASLEVPSAPRDRSVALRLLLPPGRTTIVLESVASSAPDGRSLSLSVSDLAVTPLPVDPAWAAEATLQLPPTIPAIDAAPCG
jgi:hypothetical protein